MEPKPIVLYFSKNTRETGNGGSKLVAHLTQPPPNTALIVFPHRDFYLMMDQVGWYLVRLTFNQNSRIAFATPVMDKTTLEIIRDLADIAIAS